MRERRRFPTWDCVSACRLPWWISRGMCWVLTKAHSTEFNTEIPRPGDFHARRAKAGRETRRAPCGSALRSAILCPEQKSSRPTARIVRYRTASAPLRIQQLVSREKMEKHGLVESAGLTAGRQAGGANRARRIIPGSRRASFTRSSSPSRICLIRSSAASSRPRSSYGRSRSQ